MNTQENIKQNELLTAKEVAAYLRVSRVTVWRWCQQGILPATRVGRNWRIRRDDLMHLLAITESPDALPIEPALTAATNGNSKPLPVVAIEDIAGNNGNSDT